MEKLFNRTNVLVSFTVSLLFFLGYTLTKAAFIAQHELLVYALPVVSPILVLGLIYVGALFLFLTAIALFSEKIGRRRVSKQGGPVRHIEPELNTCSGANCYQ